MKKTTYTPYSADNDEIDFGQQLRVIWTNKYKILAALLAGGILGAAFSLASTPQYRADAMLEMKRDKPNPDRNQQHLQQPNHAV